MKREEDAPASGHGARGLDVRPGVDVDATKPSDKVGPGSGGLSTAPDDPMLLPGYRRPRWLGGTSKDPLWSTAREGLGEHGLQSVRDSASHETIEPNAETTLADFVKRVHSTATDWSLVDE